MLGDKQVYTVLEVNKYIKAILSQDENLHYIYVKGEISNFKPGANGHLYFSLKDQDSLINVAMFNSYASRLVFLPKNGDEVVVLASVDAYPARGTYQLICYEINQVGRGAMLLELEKLKKTLQIEGLFDISRKRDINIYPKKIGVITARNSAAIKDILTNIKRRYPIADIYVFYSSVQGDSAPRELYEAFMKAQEYDLDTLIIGRGGGASEDLGAFNDERLVRAVANSKMPVIAAVGHEIDTTLVDYTADKRASTPTGAAELATVDRRELELYFQNCIDKMGESIQNIVENMKDDLESSKEELDRIIHEKIRELKNTLKFKNEQLDNLNPKSILDRGYSIVTNSEGKVITDTTNLKNGDTLNTEFSLGKVESVVTKVEE